MLCVPGVLEMYFMFMFIFPWIVLSCVRCRNFVLCSCVFVLCVVFSVAQEATTVDEEFLLKSHKVIEAVPHVLRRSQSSSHGLPEDWDCGSVGACDDPVGYEAIRGLHRQLDDDANGSIDVAETDEFLRDELQYENGRHKERHKEFHGNDKYINVDELWLIWKTSEVHNWTVDETVEWLITQVDLPQYEHNFRNNGVNGASLPLLAQNINNYISHSLGIKDSIHKQKIALKAMDVVLFGRPKYRNYLKDVLLTMSLLIAVGGCWFAYVQHKHSKVHMQRMLKDMEALQKAEDSLIDLQRELSKARHEQEIVSIEKQDLERRLQDEIITKQRSLDQGGGAGGEVVDADGRLAELEKALQVARSDLREAEKKLEARHWVAPTSLQHWLQLTHEIEQRNYNAKKAIAEQQLQAAKEGCDKLSKKRATFMGAFRIAHGSSIDDVDDRIVKAKSALYEVTTDLQERLNRWKQIELLCGFPIIHNPGIASLESILKPPAAVINGTSSSSIHSGLNTLTQSSSEATLREESPPPYTGVAPPPGALSNIPPPPSYSKSSPSLMKNNPEYLASTSRVVYPRECYRPVDSLDNEDLPPEDEDMGTPPSFASCPESSIPTFTLADGPSGGITLVKDKEVYLSNPSQLTASEPANNGRMGDIVRKISASIMDKKKNKPSSQALDAIKKSASSSNIVDCSVDSDSCSTASEEKSKKKKFFQTLRHRKPKT